MSDMCEDCEYARSVELSLREEIEELRKQRDSHWTLRVLNRMSWAGLFRVLFTIACLVEFHRYVDAVAHAPH